MPQDSITLQDAVKLGEYDAKILSQYPEWSKLSHAAQFELVSQGLENRRRSLYKKWQEIVNFINDSDDTTVREQAKANIEAQMKKLREEKERLYLEWSKEPDPTTV